jgi:acylphosphatase
MMERMQLIISGDVQGVGYRAWAMRLARKFKLTGWVKNREDGCVEIVAEGAVESLTEFKKLCHQGPEVCWVKEVNVTTAKATGEYGDFSVVY